MGEFAAQVRIKQFGCGMCQVESVSKLCKDTPFQRLCHGVVTTIEFAVAMKITQFDCGMRQLVVVSGPWKDTRQE